ncbi:MAG: hypothetical protein GY805_09090, partial [Chloroflexi bacterium]|nr:hypothetical protein [Chloroflexota bacterium]
MIDTRIYLLGGMRVEQNGRFLSGIRSQKAFALLGYLAVEARPVARTTLAALFWGLEPEKKGRRELRRVLHNLTSLIPDCLDANRQTVQFGKNSNLWIDIRPFANLVNADDTNSLLQAVELYRGELMEGLYLDDCPQFETWLLGERERFRQQFIWGLGTLVAKYQSTGDFETALTYTQRLLSLDNWREETHQQMMLLLARTGQFSAALHQYKLCRRILFDELGVEPSAKTTLLYEQLKTAVSTPRHNLPAQAIPFVGRDKDLPTLQQTLMQPTCRLITITGLGGMGKTRLALKAAWQMDESNQVFFINGIWFVPLFKMVDQLSNTQDMSDQIALAITHALSLTFSSTRSPSDQLLNYLQDKELLLLLDNYEQLLPHTSLVQRILQETKHVKLLITSRECLNLQQETILQVNGLTTPPANYQFNSLADLQQYDSVRLFDSIARRVQPDFSLAAEGNDAANICRHLHGMPLALELTAVWVKTLSCKDVFAEIEMGMENLHKTQHNLPSRHHSIQTLFDTSWSRLSVKERQSVQKCAIFHGGFTYEAANHVAAADHATLAALVDKSLIRRTKAGRYEMHELLRQFEVSKLTEESDEPAKTRQQHGRYYTTFLCQREETMMGFNQLTTLAEIDADLPNILQTWGWVMASQDYDLIDKLIWPLVIYFELRNRYKEAYRLFYNAWQELIALPDVGVEKPALLACLSLHSSYFEMKLGRIDQARLALENTLPSIRQYGTQQNIGWALMALGESYWICGAYWRKMAESCFAEALAIFEKVSPIWLVGYTQTRLAQSIIWRLGQSNERAQHLLQNAHDVAVELENNWLHFYVEIISSRLWG